MCREYDDPTIAKVTSTGSSPRVWGTCGRTTTRQGCPSVHPHVCGEHDERSRKRDGAIRFIPTCVGTCYPSRSWLPRRRFIPTCVGNIRRSSSLFNRTAVHPHVCGEHLLVGEFAIGCRRFISTCVGNISRIGRRCAPASVHPHVCGEHPSPRGTLRNPRGSSPRVWGTCRPRVGRFRRIRFIPTCVGNIHAQASER